jgi:hypothetical protein
MLPPTARHTQHAASTWLLLLLVLPAGAASMSLQQVTEAYSGIVRELSLSLALHEARSGDALRSRAALPGVPQPLDNIRTAFDRWVTSASAIACAAACFPESVAAAIS